MGDLFKKIMEKALKDYNFQSDNYDNDIAEIYKGQLEENLSNEMKKIFGY